jgi:hypothetical protein
MKKVEVKKQMADVKTTTFFCDKCKNKIKETAYNVFDCTIELRVGRYDAWENDYYGDDYRVDLCEDCAKFLFFDLLPSSNIDVIKKD